jgi:hypothetical protein
MPQERPYGRLWRAVRPFSCGSTGSRFGRLYGAPRASRYGGVPGTAERCRQGAGRSAGAGVRGCFCARCRCPRCAPPPGAAGAGAGASARPRPLPPVPVLLRYCIYALRRAAGAGARRSRGASVGCLSRPGSGCPSVYGRVPPRGGDPQEALRKTGRHSNSGRERRGMRIYRFPHTCCPLRSVARWQRHARHPGTDLAAQSPRHPGASALPRHPPPALGTLRSLARSAARHRPRRTSPSTLPRHRGASTLPRAPVPRRRPHASLGPWRHLGQPPRRPRRGQHNEGDMHP